VVCGKRPADPERFRNLVAAGSISQVLSTVTSSS
jgi:hypothetical protein